MPVKKKIKINKYPSSRNRTADVMLFTRYNSSTFTLAESLLVNIFTYIFGRIVFQVDFQSSSLSTVHPPREMSQN